MIAKLLIIQVLRDIQILEDRLLSIKVMENFNIGRREQVKEISVGPRSGNLNSCLWAKLRRVRINMGIVVTALGDFMG